MKKEEMRLFKHLFLKPTFPVPKVPFRVTLLTSAEVKKTVQLIVTAYGAIHYAHNNAGTEGERGRLHECTEENFAHIMNVSCHKTQDFYCERQIAQVYFCV